MRFPQFPRATLFALVSATLLLAAQATPIHADQGPDLATVAEAYGQYWLFILNVAAGNDGKSVAPAAERAVVDKLAANVVRMYPQMNTSRRQAMAQYPGWLNELWQYWPTLADSQRSQYQQQWAAEMEPGFLSANCDAVYLLVNAQLIPMGPSLAASYDHARQCLGDGQQASSDWGAQQAYSGGVDSNQAYSTLTNVLETAHIGNSSFFGR